jgi:pimeloyl-ACP methyl ester carboxylesterase
MVSSAPSGPEARGAFGPVKQVAAGLLDVGYVDVGPPDGPAVVLLHGWPYDIHTFAEVSPLLAAAGYRVIVPYVRCYGTTRFLSAARRRKAACHRARGRRRAERERVRAALPHR